jgi:hypothetical protein
MMPSSGPCPAARGGCARARRGAALRGVALLERPPATPRAGVTAAAWRACMPTTARMERRRVREVRRTAILAISRAHPDAMATSDEAMVDADKPAEVAKAEEPADVATLVRLFCLRARPCLLALSRRAALTPAPRLQLKRNAALLEKSVATKETRFATRALRQARHAPPACLPRNAPRRCAARRARIAAAIAHPAARQLQPPVATRSGADPGADTPLHPQTSALRKRLDNDSVTAFIKARAAFQREPSTRCMRPAGSATLEAARQPLLSASVEDQP